jgi:hypothetical protein
MSVLPCLGAHGPELIRMRHERIFTEAIARIRDLGHKGMDHQDTPCFTVETRVTEVFGFAARYLVACHGTTLEQRTAILNGRPVSLCIEHSVSQSLFASDGIRSGAL